MAARTGQPPSPLPDVTTFDRRPLPRRVADAIEELITTAGLGPGDRLPSEAVLSQRFGVGRSTLRDALAHLERTGVVERRWGVGTLVASPSPAMGLETLESLESLAARQGWVCGTTDLRVEARAATAPQAERLGAEPGDPVTVIERTKTRDRTPVARMTSVVAERVVPHAEVAAGFTGSITDFLRRRPGRLIHHARAEVSAGRAGRRLASYLPLRRGAPVLVLDEEFLGAEGEVVAWNVLEFVPGSIRVEIIRRV